MSEVVRLEFGWGVEMLAGERVEDNLVRLQAFSEFVALVPGDVVVVDEAGAVVGLREPRDVFVVEAYFRIGTPADVIDEHAAQWSRSTDVHKSSALTVTLLSESSRWIRDEIVVSEAGPVVAVQVQRHRDEPYDLRAAMDAERGEASITCPKCGRTSHNPNDVREGYCGACHDWTSRS